jgi:hypothetical protein
MNPVQSKIFDKLRLAFAEEAVLFWDETQGHELGILLKPSFKSEQEFSVLNSKLRSILNEENKTNSNTSELVKQFILESDGLLSLVQ